MVGDNAQKSVGGMDGFTAKILLDAATSGTEGADTAGKIYQALQAEKTTPAHRIAQAKKLYQDLGYTEGAIVEFVGGPGSLGKIIGFRDATGGFYPATRYPVIVQGPGGAYEQSIFVTAYDNFINNDGDPHTFLKENKDDLLLRVVDTNEVPDTKHIMQEQAKLADGKHNLHSLIRYVQMYDSDTIKEHDYIYKYALSRIDRMRYTELNLLAVAFDYIDSKDFDDEIDNQDVRELLVKRFYERCEWEGTNLLDVCKLYDNAKNPIYKTRLENIIHNRIKDIDDKTLYDFATSVKGREAEQIALAELETR